MLCSGRIWAMDDDKTQTQTTMHQRGINCSICCFPSSCDRWSGGRRMDDGHKREIKSDKCYLDEIVLTGAQNG